MSTTTHSWQGEPSDADAPLVSLGPTHGLSTDFDPMGGSASDSCSRCGAGMAPDQRYCTECGERRGKPRFSVASGAQATPARAQATPPSRRRRMPQSSSTTLIAGIATLLLALGVGVLIGENNGSTTSAKGPTVITVGGGSAGAATTSTPSTASSPGTSTGAGSTGSAASSHNSTNSSKHSKASKSSTGASNAAAAPVSAAKATSSAALNNAAKAAQKTLGTNANIGSPTSQPGQSCAAGTPGCENGKQTPNLFGGG